ncbi:unnamed protein product, partial [Sphacelaria rigidula]
HAPAELESRGDMRLQIKTRHGPQMKNCVLRFITDGDSTATRADELAGTQSSSSSSSSLSPQRGHVQLEIKDSGLAPGQFAAFYLGEECLGSGVISSSVARGGGGGSNFAA